MIKYKKFLLSLNIMVAVAVMTYGLGSQEANPVSVIVSVFAALTSLILLNLVYFDLEKFVIDLFDKIRNKVSNMGAQASQAN